MCFLMDVHSSGKPPRRTLMISLLSIRLCFAPILYLSIIQAQKCLFITHGLLIGFFVITSVIKYSVKVFFFLKKKKKEKKYYGNPKC